MILLSYFDWLTFHHDVILLRHSFPLNKKPETTASSFFSYLLLLVLLIILLSLHVCLKSILFVHLNFRQQASLKVVSMWQIIMAILFSCFKCPACHETGEFHCGSWPCIPSYWKCDFDDNEHYLLFSHFSVLPVMRLANSVVVLDGAFLCIGNVTLTMIVVMAATKRMNFAPAITEDARNRKEGDLSLRAHVCWSICPSFCLFVCLLACLSVCLSIGVSVLIGWRKDDSKKELNLFRATNNLF